ncbi:hypothetical protein CRM22_010603 [Opisthorchis felineus]|uniref:tRNA-dihydrouridine(16/17) synthase [NAD(P)(+)] n=1 Tax=Opisthorchis felineus TaxID=147828 RepID=A0A4S2KRY2_OPIFE|nr:hypothetical protein CRM22_010603 [Opisthorchis felineus]
MGVKEDLLTQLGSPKYVLAPMVDASELAWRLLARRYGAQLTYTPMIHAMMFLKDKAYRQSCLQFSPEDRPLIVQFCTNSPETFVKAAQTIQPYCDAVDINLGCPQKIAKHGHYGAFLQDEWDLIRSIVNRAVSELDVPVTCKIRIFPDVERTVSYAKMLEAAGASLLVVHGRTREMKGQLTGLADWNQIKRVKAELTIPVVSNGNIQYPDDIARCLSVTNADAVMSAEGHLHNPAIFAGLQPSVYSMCMEYLDIVKLYPTTMPIVRGHIFKLLHHALVAHPHFRQTVGCAQNLEEMLSVIQEMRDVCSSCESNAEKISRYPHWICQPYERPQSATEKEVPDSPSNTPAATADASQPSYRHILQEERRIRRETKREAKSLKRALSEKASLLCKQCRTNRSGQQCPSSACRTCCWSLDPDRSTGCKVHQHPKKKKT